MVPAPPLVDQQAMSTTTSGACRRAGACRAWRHVGAGGLDRGSGEPDGEPVRGPYTGVPAVGTPSCIRMAGTPGGLLRSRQDRHRPGVDGRHGQAPVPDGAPLRWLLLRALWGQLVYLWVGAGEEKLTRIGDSALRLATGWDRERVRRIAREAIEEVIEPIVYDEALALIEDHREAGRPVFIVSASPEEIVAPLAEHLGVDGGSPPAPRSTTGGTRGRSRFYVSGRTRPTAMREVAAAEGIDLDASYAYSDSATDEPMLAAVGHPVAVNPDRDLLRTAREREWEVRYFVRPVRLRDRLPAPAAGAGRGRRRGVGGRLGGRGHVAELRRLGPGPATGAGVAGSDGADLLGGDGAEGDEQDEEQQLLHHAARVAGSAGSALGAGLARGLSWQRARGRRGSRAQLAARSGAGLAAAQLAARSGAGLARGLSWQRASGPAWPPRRRRRAAGSPA